MNKRHKFLPWLLALVIIGMGYYAYQLQTQISDLRQGIESLNKSQLSSNKMDDRSANSNLTSFSSNEYNFSLNFPKIWGEVKEVKKDFGESTLNNSDILKTYYFESTQDDQRFFYLIVGKPALKGSLYEDSPRVFLGEGLDYVYYYSSTIVPPNCSTSFLEEGVYESESCNRFYSIWKNEVQDQIVKSFKIN